MTRSDIKPGYTIKLNNGSIYTVYIVDSIKYICRPQVYHISLRLNEVCNENLSPLPGISPIVKIWDNGGKLVYFLEKTVTKEEIAAMLNVPVERLRIKL